MIDFEGAPTRVADYRGTIEVYTVDLGDFDAAGDWVPDIEWYWRCKAKNGQILASGEGYKRRAGALNAIDTQYASRLRDTALRTLHDLKLMVSNPPVVPWRVVIHDRNGDTTIGALY